MTCVAPRPEPEGQRAASALRGDGAAQVVHALEILAVRLVEILFALGQEHDDAAAAVRVRAELVLDLEEALLSFVPVGDLFDVRIALAPTVIDDEEVAHAGAPGIGGMGSIVYRWLRLTAPIPSLTSRSHA